MRGRIGRYNVVPTFVDDLLSLTTTTTTTPDDHGYDNYDDDDDDDPAEASGTKKITRSKGVMTMVPMDDPDLLSRMRIASTMTDDRYDDDNADRLERDGGSSSSSFYSSSWNALRRRRYVVRTPRTINELIEMLIQTSWM